MKLLDLCCGSGGWTKGFKDEGFDCTGVDIQPIKQYPGKLIVCDIHDFKTAERFDVIVASPECRGFGPARIWSQQGYLAQHQELDMIWRCFQIIAELRPRYWIIENAKYIKDFIAGYRHVVYNPGFNACRKQWVLYGEFPIPGMFSESVTWDGYSISSKDPRRAEIPYPMARAFARAIKAADSLAPASDC